MRNKFLGQIMLTATLIAGTGIASAYTKPVVSGPRTDAEITKSIVHEIRMYPQYSIWDDINIGVANGQVTVTGAVNQPYKKSDIENIVRHVPGVTSLASEIKVLPLNVPADTIRSTGVGVLHAAADVHRPGDGAQPADRDVAIGRGMN